MKTWSAQQEAIFSFVVNSVLHFVVRARAGTGKTTTIVEAVKRYLAAHPGKLVLVCAFNKRIADELKERFIGVAGVEVKTLHAAGFAIVLRYWERVRVNDKRKDPVSREDDLTNRVSGTRVPDALKKLISKLHTLGRETMPLATSGADLFDLAVNFECEPDEEWTRDGWTTSDICDYAYKAMELAAAEKPVKTGIDFADMIFLPVRNRWTNKKYDLGLVDEAQDMTLAQLMIAEGLSHRIGVVGDDRQAIYGFRGADSDALDRLKTKLDATEFGLNTTYRCGRVIVELMKEIVPDFVAGPSNPEGEILDLPKEKLVETAEYGDFIISRLNAPLVSIAMSLLRSGKRARIAGRSIGDDLKALVRRLTKSARSVPEFIDRLEGWKEREIKRAEKLRKPEAKIEQVLDTADMLLSLSEGVKNVAEIVDRIEALFTDNGLGVAGVITLSSVHKAKGLEADRVFVLASTLRNDSKEEDNIRYVAGTRAKTSLVYVSEVARAA